MRIAIDGTTLCTPDGSGGAGIEHYSWSIVTAMLAIGKKHSFIIAVPAELSTIRRAQLTRLHPRVKLLSPLFPHTSFFSRHVFLPARFFLARPDVLFSPHGQLPLLWKGKSVIVVHDLCIYEHPEWFPPDQSFSVQTIVPRSLEKADRIIAVSQATKEKLIKLFPSTQKKIRVIYEGVNLLEAYEALRSTDAKIRRFPFDRDVVLMLGTQEPRKNMVNACMAFDQFLRSHPEQASQVRLVIAGKKGWHAARIEQEISRINQAWEKVEPNGVISCLGPVTEEEKWNLLARASCLLFPSLDEGFGLPVLEAMAVGTPVIASNRGAIPEVGGDVAMYVEPEDTEAMSFALTQCLLVPEGVRGLKELGLARASEFSWEKAAQETLDFITTFPANKR